MIIEADFVNHWKTRALVAKIGEAEALRGLLLLFGHCQTRTAWEFQLTPLMLAGIMSCGRNPDELFKTMLDLRWIEPAEELGWFRVHEWGEVNKGLVGHWAGGARIKGAWWHPRGHVVTTPKPAKTATGSASPPTTGVISGSTSGSSSGMTDKRGEDWSGEEKIGLEGSESAHALPKPVGWSDQRVAIMLGWLGFREQVGKPIHPASWQSLCDRLSILPDDALEACVKDSVANGWTTLYPDKFTLPPPPGSNDEEAKNREKKEGGGGAAKKIKPADFPWREVAQSIEGWEPVGTWEDQTPRTRSTLRDTWARQSKDTQAAMFALSESATAAPEKSE